MTPDERLAAFQKFVAAKPDDPFTRYGLAMQLRSMGRDEDAVSVFRELGRRAPDYVPTWMMLGQALEGLGRDGEAAQAYQDGIASAASPRGCCGWRASTSRPAPPGSSARTSARPGWWAARPAPR